MPDVVKYGISNFTLIGRLPLFSLMPPIEPPNPPLIPLEQEKSVNVDQTEVEVVV